MEEQPSAPVDDVDLSESRAEPELLGSGQTATTPCCPPSRRRAPRSRSRARRPLRPPRASAARTSSSFTSG